MQGTLSDDMLMDEFEDLRQRYNTGDLTEFPQGAEETDDRVYLHMDEAQETQFAMLPDGLRRDQELLIFMMRGLYEAALRNNQDAAPDEGSLVMEARNLTLEYAHIERPGMRLITRADMFEASDVANYYFEPRGQYGAGYVFTLFNLNQARPAEVNPNAQHGRERLN